MLDICFHTFVYLTSVFLPMFHLWFISIIAKLFIKSPKNVTTATRFRYIFLYTSSLPDWICTHPSLLISFSWKVFWGVYQILEDLNVILRWVKRKPAGPIYLFKLQENVRSNRVSRRGWAEPKGQLCVKACIMAMSLRIRCNLGRFKLDKTYLKVVSWSDFKIFFPIIPNCIS